MKKECIFKCYAQTEWWYVYEMNFGVFGIRYRVYKGRRWFGRTDFELKQCAICAAVNSVTVGLAGCRFAVEES